MVCWWWFFLFLFFFCCVYIEKQAKRQHCVFYVFFFSNLKLKLQQKAWDKIIIFMMNIILILVQIYLWKETGGNNNNNNKKKSLNTLGFTYHCQPSEMGKRRITVDLCRFHFRKPSRPNVPDKCLRYHHDLRLSIFPLNLNDVNKDVCVLYRYSLLCVSSRFQHFQHIFTHDNYVRLYGL